LHATFVLKDLTTTTTKNTPFLVMYFKIHMVKWTKSQWFHWFKL